MDARSAIEFFATNGGVTGVVAAINNADVNRVGESSTLTYDVWVNGPNGPTRHNGVKPMTPRPPYDVRIVGVPVGTPVVPVYFGQYIRFLIVGEWQYAEAC